MFDNDFLKQMMTENDVSGNDLAGLLDVNPGTISRWCNGDSEPTYTNLLKMAHFFKRPNVNEWAKKDGTDG